LATGTLGYSLANVKASQVYLSPVISGKARGNLRNVSN